LLRTERISIMKKLTLILHQFFYAYVLLKSRERNGRLSVSALSGVALARVLRIRAV